MVRRGVVRLQACLRCHVAVRRAAKLRQEAQEQKRLEDKVLRLQRKLEDVGSHSFMREWGDTRGSSSCVLRD